MLSKVALWILEIDLIACLVLTIIVCPILHAGKEPLWAWCVLMCLFLTAMIGVVLLVIGLVSEDNLGIGRYW